MTKEPSSTTNLVPFKYFWLSISPHFSLFILGPHAPLPTDRYHWTLVHKLPKLGLYEMTVLPLTKKSTLKQYKSIPTVTCLPCKNHPAHWSGLDIFKAQLLFHYIVSSDSDEITQLPLHRCRGQRVWERGAGVISGGKCSISCQFIHPSLHCICWSLNKTTEERHLIMPSPTRRRARGLVFSNNSGAVGLSIIRWDEVLGITILIIHFN